MIFERTILKDLPPNKDIPERPQRCCATCRSFYIRHDSFSYSPCGKIPYEITGRCLYNSKEKYPYQMCDNYVPVIPKNIDLVWSWFIRDYPYSWMKTNE